MKAGGRLSTRDMLIVQAKTIEYIDSMENFYIYKPRALILRVIMMYAGITYIFALLTFPITAAFMALFWGILIFKYTQANKAPRQIQYIARKSIYLPCVYDSCSCSRRRILPTGRYFVLFRS